MKKIIGLILTLILLFSFTAGSFAAGKLSITKQPVTSTTNKRGSVSFSVKISGSVNSITWHFIDPSTNADYTGKKLSQAVKGVKVSNPNGKTISLSKVPESMHGWIVYCHINGNGYKLDSDRVRLLVYGLEPPADDIVTAPSSDDSGSKKDDKKASEDDEVNPSLNNGDSGDEDGEDSGEGGTISDRTITVSCSAKILRKLNSSGTPEEGAPSSSLEFTNSGSFIVSSEEPITSWTINGIEINPTEPLNEFKVLNVTEDISLRVKIYRAPASSIQLDTSNMCKIKCTGCTFTYLGMNLRSVSEGEVPAGAPINVVANSSANAENGYRINGDEPINQGVSSFRLIVSGDLEIIAE